MDTEHCFCSYIPGYVQIRSPVMATTGDYVKLHFIVFLWGFTAILGKLISIPSVEMVFYRTLLAAIGMGVVIMIAREATFRINRVDIVKLLLTGFIVSLHWIMFFGSGRISNVSVSLVGFATASLWTSFIEPLSYGRKIKPYEVFLGCFVIAGIIIIFSFKFNYKLGFLLGIIAGLTAAIFAVINSKMVTRIHPYTITFYEMAGACVGTLLFLPVYKIYWAEKGVLNFHASAYDWLYIAILSIVCSVYAYSLGVELMKRMPVFLIQLTLNLEPIYGIVMAILIFKGNETMDGNFYAGTLIILSAVFAYSFLKKRFDKPFTTAQ